MKMVYQLDPSKIGEFIQLQPGFFTGRGKSSFLMELLVEQGGFQLGNLAG
jgi:hypothetical protein